MVDREATPCYNTFINTAKERKMPVINGQTVDNFEISDVDPRDYPDFSDAHISYAEYAESGEPLDDDALDQLNEQYPDLVWELAMEHYQ